jgi:hypothetical protein
MNHHPIHHYLFITHPKEPLMTFNPPTQQPKATPRATP